MVPVGRVIPVQTSILTWDRVGLCLCMQQYGSPRVHATKTLSPGADDATPRPSKTDVPAVRGRAPASAGVGAGSPDAIDALEGSDKQSPAKTDKADKVEKAPAVVVEVIPAARGNGRNARFTDTSPRLP